MSGFLVALVALFGFVVFTAGIFLPIMFWLFALKSWGFFFPESNKEYVILKGGFPIKFIRGDTTGYAEKTDPHVATSPWKMIYRDSSDMRWWEILLYQHFKIRYMGLPFICSLGKIRLGYPPQLQSISGRDHSAEEDVPAFDIHHNYLVFLKGVDFQGGIPFNLKLNLEVTLIRSDAAWGRNGRFLDPLGQYIEGAVKATALEIPANEFIGKSKQANEPLTATSKEWRKKICDACMELNDQTNSADGATSNIGLAELCGYEIKAISYNDIEPDGEIAVKRLFQLERLTESQTEIQITANERQQAENRAAGAAATITAQGEAEAKIIVLKGDANAKALFLKGEAESKVQLLKGNVDIEVLKKKKDAIGSELIVAELSANAIKESGITTLVMGGGNGASFILPLSNTPRSGATNSYSGNTGTGTASGS